MPRGADYADAPVQSDNAIEAGENKIAGAPKGDSDEPVSTGVDRSHKAAPLPEGISEMQNSPASGGGSKGLTGEGSGHGAKEPTVNRAAEELMDKK
ncbi:MAG: hypothetical protein Q9164_001681 [Protoblastenia rupestris]